MSCLTYGLKTDLRCWSSGLRKSKMLIILGTVKVTGRLLWYICSNSTAVMTTMKWNETNDHGHHGLLMKMIADLISFMALMAHT